MSMTIPRTFGRGIGARKLVFVRLYSETLAGARTEETFVEAGGVVGATGAVVVAVGATTGALVAGGAVNEIGGTFTSTFFVVTSAMGSIRLISNLSATPTFNRRAQR